MSDRERWIAKKEAETANARYNEFLNYGFGEGDEDDWLHVMPLHNMKFILMNLLDEGAISATDLDGFSEELRGALLTYKELIDRRKKWEGIAIC